MRLPLATLGVSSCSVPHCCDSLCEYNRIRSFNSCGSKLCESMAATSIIFLFTRAQCKTIIFQLKHIKSARYNLLTSQNPALFDSMHSIHFFVAQNFDYLAINHHYLLSPLGYYLSDVEVNVFARLSLNSEKVHKKNHQLRRPV